MKKGVKIGIITGVIILIVATAGGYFFINDRTQKAKIMEEFSQIEELTKSEDFDIDALNKKTSTIVTNGKYANVEKAAKNYASDLFNTAYEIRTVLEDEKLAQMLTASNYEQDGPEFTATKKYLSETKQKLEDGKTKMLSYLEENKINSYIEAETKDAYSSELYKQLLREDIEISDKEKDELNKSIEKVQSVLSIEEEIIDFLIQNKDQWKVQGGQILFNSNNLVIKYNGFLTKLSIL